MSKHCIREKLIFKAMEKNVHPLCACGQPVVAHEYTIPNYDESGSVDSFDVVVDFEDVCGDCLIRREEESGHEQFIDNLIFRGSEGFSTRFPNADDDEDCEDDLPF